MGQKGGSPRGGGDGTSEWYGGRVKDGLTMGEKGSEHASFSQPMDGGRGEGVFDVPDAADAGVDTCRAGTHNTRHL